MRTPLVNFVCFFPPPTTCANSPPSSSQASLIRGDRRQSSSTTLVYSEPLRTITLNPCAAVDAQELPCAHTLIPFHRFARDMSTMATAAVCSSP